MKKSGTKTSLFLIELIISLLLFAFCAAICIQIFAGAKFRTQDSASLSKSVFLASSAAERYKACGGDMERLRGFYGADSAQLLDGALRVYYDENWHEAPAPSDSQLPYIMTISPAGGDGGATITVRETGEDDETPPGDSPEESGDIFSIEVRAVSVDG
jgi:hypothetical protein